MSGVAAHVDARASEAAGRIGADGYATGNHVAFRGAPDLRTAAHEAAHVIQQQRGASVAGRVGQRGDRYERHADAVADRVVAGHSSASLLGTIGSTEATPVTGQVQRQERKPAATDEAMTTGDAGGAGDDPEAMATGVGPDRSPYRAELEPKRTEAAFALGAVESAFGKYVEAIVLWQSKAWSVALGVTGTSPDLGLTSADWNAIFMAPFDSKLEPLGALPATGDASSSSGATATGILGSTTDAVGNTGLGVAISAVGSTLTKRALTHASEGAAVGLQALLSAFEGTGLPGFILGTLVNLIWPAITGLFGGKDATELAKIAAVKRASEYMGLVQDAIEERTKVAWSDWDQHIAHIRAFIRASQSGADLDALAGWLQLNSRGMNASGLDPGTCANAIVTHWIKQHSADAESPESKTSDEAMDGAKDMVAPEKPASSQKDLFVHQTKLALTRLAIQIDAPAALMESKIAGLSEKPAGAVAKALDGLVLRLEPASTSAFVRAMLASDPSYTNGGGLLGAYSFPHENPVEAIELGHVEVTCTLSLEVDASGSVIVDELRFAAKAKAGYSPHENEADVSTDADRRGLFWSRTWQASPR